MPAIYEMAVRSMLNQTWRGFDFGVFVDLLEIKTDEKDEFDFKAVAPLLDSSPEKVVLAAAYAGIGDNARMHYYDYSGDYEENEELDLIYEALKKLGYEMSDEEKAMQDGTHELLKIEVEDES